MKNEKTVQILFDFVKTQNNVSKQVADRNLPLVKNLISSMIASSVDVLDEPVSVAGILTIQRNYQTALMKEYFDSDEADLEDTLELFQAKVMSEITEERLNRVLNSTEGELRMLEMNATGLYEALGLGDELMQKCIEKSISIRELLEAAPQIIFGDE